ncbi:MAG: NACHT domain-containing protein [Candidatus Kentron sp. G]|nr:MAG: NACHT domain-containing protein [Candidatus Kentron sp. G]
MSTELTENTEKSDFFRVFREFRGHFFFFVFLRVLRGSLLSLVAVCRAMSFVDKIFLSLTSSFPYHPMKPIPRTDIEQTAGRMVDRMGETGPDAPHREASPLFDFIGGLGEAFSTISANEFLAAFIATVLGGLVVVFIAWLSLRAWGGLSRLFWRAVARLGVLPGLEFFVVRGYLRRVRERFGTVRNIYLDREEELDLNRVFVPLTLRARSNRADQTNQSGAQVIATPQTTREILTQNPRLVILGAPGSGKTTLLKALASGVSQHQWPEWRELVPVFVPLRAFSRVPDQPELYDWLAHQLLPAEYGIRHGEPLLKRLLAKGRLLLLLDGLDEVNAVDLPSLLDRVGAFLEEYGGEKGDACRILLTCREQNYDLMSDAVLLRTRGMAEYRFGNMRDSEVDAMVESRRQDFAARPNRSIPNFLTAIRANPQVFRLHRNPLLLTLSIGLYLHRVDDAVPQHRTEFYDESIQHLLRRHDFLIDPQLGKANHFEVRDKVALLCQFALSSMEAALARGEDFEDFPVADLIAAADGLARQLLSIEPGQARALVMEIQEQAGLIADTGNRETYTFAHRSFHEYCAARELANLGDEGFERLQKNLTHPAWRQSALFYCGMDHRYAKRVGGWLWDPSSHEYEAYKKVDKLALAGYCAAVLVRPQVDLRLRVMDASFKALSEIDSEDVNYNFLLLSLFESGQDAPQEVYATLDKSVGSLFVQGDFAQLARRQIKLIGELQEEKDKRIRAERDAMWKDISRSAAHKIGNPLFAIETYLDPLLKRISDDRRQDAEEIVEKMRLSLEKAKDSLDQFKSLARAQEIKPVSCLLCYVLRNSRDIVP